MKWPMNIQWTAYLKNLLTERRKITFVVYLVNRLLCHLFWCSAEKYLAKICKYVNFGANLLFDDIILHFHLSTGSLRWKLICVFIHFVCWDFFMCLFSIRQFTVDEKWSYILARNSKCRFEALTMTGGGGENVSRIRSPDPGWILTNSFRLARRKKKQPMSCGLSFLSVPRIFSFRASSNLFPLIFCCCYSRHQVLRYSPRRTAKETVQPFA